ncbi:protein NUCLEAR FUSION DEFECTIVE 4 [Dorcoceras hygrometricum]|uniref:Protein NUCLEAR FUSION DEFECTIVE 4 n=1 Tax=Dorcoceras hygrometricum TaxID=472368 RepID=A0A2Z7CN12_9LAMI|nr:protein NUCLEAR FUSION DEFECTIVE 4 [Dorcoceras hygrometricum]
MNHCKRADILKNEDISVLFGLFTCLSYMSWFILLGIRIRPPGQAAEERKTENREAINTKNKSTFYDIHRMFSVLPRWHLCLAPTGVSRTRLFSIVVVTPIRSTTRSETPSSGCTRSPDEISTNGFSTSSWPETNFPAKTAATAAAHGGGDGLIERGEGRVAADFARKSHFPKSSSRAQHIELSIRVGISNLVLV